MGAPPPPPATWLRDIPTVAANQISAPAGPPLEASLDERRGAARKITEVLAAEDRQTGVDLADLLENGARAEYSFQQYGVGPLSLPRAFLSSRSRVAARFFASC